MKLPRMMIPTVTMTTARRCFLLDDDTLLFMSAACCWELGGCFSLYMEYNRYGSFVFFLEYLYKGISMFFVRPPHPRENNDLEFVGERTEGRTTSPQ